MKILNGDSESSATTNDNGKTDRVAVLNEIKHLHKEVDGSVLDCWRNNLPKMIRLGEMLAALKDGVGHGNWMSYFRENEGYCGFSEDTGERYMRLYKYRDRFEQSDANSAPVRNLTDALLLIKEPDPEKRRALLVDAQKTGKSIRANVRSKAKKPIAPPDARTTLGPDSPGNNDETQEDTPNVQASEHPLTAPRAANNGSDCIAHNAPLGLEGMSGDPVKTLRSVPESDPGSKSSGIVDETRKDTPAMQAPAPSVELHEVPTNNSDHAKASAPHGDSAEPLVLVEQPEVGKRHLYMEGNVLHRIPKPYHLMLKDPSNGDGWVAAYTQLGIDGPSYYGGYSRVLKQAVAVLDVQLSEEESERPTEETCFEDLLCLLRQWHVKLNGDRAPLERLRKRMQKLVGPGLWKAFVDEAELIDAGESTAVQSSR
jgi:DUF3102 family protein